MNIATQQSFGGAAPAVLNALPHPVVMIAPDQRIAGANQAAESFFQTSASVLARYRLDHFVPFGCPLFSLIEQVRESGVSVTEYRVDISSPRLGAERIVDIYASPVAERPEHVTVMLLPRSVTEKIDRQLTHRGAARTVTGLASMLAHEIKNPLSGIRGAAQLLETNADENDRALTRLICDETDRIVGLVQRMETFADERPTERQAVNIHAILERVKAVARNGFARDIRMVEEYDPSLPPVHANRDQLIQVFLNLAKNAAEALAGTTRRGDRVSHSVPARHPAFDARKPQQGEPAARILGDRQRPRRAGGSGALHLRPLRDLEDEWQRPGACAGRQDHRRAWRRHRMRIAAAPDGFPHPHAGAFGRGAG